MPACKLCLQQTKELESSHIISECFYEHLYDAKHRFIPISDDINAQLRLKQKGFTEPLLCNNCETKFSKWESLLIRDLKDIGNEKSNFLKISSLQQDILSIEKIRYNEFKKAVLSLFWRMSISSLSLFDNYRFGPYEEKLRLILLNDTPISQTIYPIHIMVNHIEWRFYPGVLILFPRSKDPASGFSIYTAIIYGFQFSLFLTEGKFNKYTVAFLRDTDPNFIYKFDLRELKEKGGVMGRLNDSDVIEAMDKMKPAS